MNTTGKQVNAGDLITASLMNGLIADLAALDARIAKLEDGGAGPAGKGHGTLDIAAKGLDNSGNKKLGWIQLMLKDADQAASFTIRLVDTAAEIIAAGKYTVVDQDSKPLQQPFTLEPEQATKIGILFTPSGLPYTSGSILVDIHCKDFPQDSNLNKQWRPVMVA